MTTTTTDFAAVSDALDSSERFLVVTHENPDGDALGSMLGATLGLRALGKDVLMYLAGDAPLPGEFGFLPLGELRRDLPDDLEERVLLAVDCANERRIAAELVEAGADLNGIFRNVWESVQFAKLKLLARALDRAQLYEGGRLLVTYLLRTDFAEVGAEEPYSEGIIDYLRQVAGTELVALIRESLTDGGPTHRVSLRSSKDEVDVSAIARQRGGGGHRQAAGFSSDQPIEEIVAFIRRAFVAATSDEGAADAAASG